MVTSAKRLSAYPLLSNSFTFQNLPLRHSLVFIEGTFTVVMASKKRGNGDICNGVNNKK